MRKEKDLLEQKVFLTSVEELDLYGLADKISQVVDNDSLPNFIAYLDSLYSDWDCTLKVARHFEALKNEYIEEVKDDAEKDDLSPKKIKLR